MSTLKEQGLRRCKHDSAYFRGAYNRYGRYQWDVKYNGFNDDSEIETARHAFFGPENEEIDALLGRKINSFFDGRSGGWFAVDTSLTETELQKLDEYIEGVMKYLPGFLEEVRKLNGDKT